MTCSPSKYKLDDQIKMDEQGRACGMHVGELVMRTGSTWKTFAYVTG